MWHIDIAWLSGASLSVCAADMPTMAECSGFFAMCDEAGDTFSGLCGGSGGSSSSGTLPPMRMYLHQGIRGERWDAGAACATECGRGLCRLLTIPVSPPGEPSQGLGLVAELSAAGKEGGHKFFLSGLLA